MIVDGSGVSTFVVVVYDADAGSFAVVVDRPGVSLFVVE